MLFSITMLSKTRKPPGSSCSPPYASPDKTLINGAAESTNPLILSIRPQALQFSEAGTLKATYMAKSSSSRARLNWREAKPQTLLQASDARSRLA